MKKLVCVLLFLCLLVMLTTVVFAAQESFSVVMSAPFLGSSRHTNMQIIDTYPHGYVSLNGTTLATKYSIWYVTGTTPSLSDDNLATNYLSVSTTGNKYFTYQSGYGGQNTKWYCMWMYPDIDVISPNYLPYYVSGNWAP